MIVKDSATASVVVVAEIALDARMIATTGRDTRIATDMMREEEVVIGIAATIREEEEETGIVTVIVDTNREEEETGIVIVIADTTNTKINAEEVVTMMIDVVDTVAAKKIGIENNATGVRILPLHKAVADKAIVGQVSISRH